MLSADQMKSAVAPQVSILERSGRMEKMSAALKMSEHMRFIAADLQCVEAQITGVQTIVLSADQLKSAVAPQISILERSGRMEKRASEHLSASIVLSVDQ